MRVISVKAQNFASYKEIEFNAADRGLTLIAGPTGSGKSTLCDLVPWALFGHTAKNGAADDVLTWRLKESTAVTAIVETAQGQVEVTRKRGKGNDFFYVLNGETHRGKDMNDTQKKLNELLGIDLETYLTGAYFHEFSSTSAFFTAAAKVRRQVVEQLVDLSFAANMQKSLAEYKKAIKVAKDKTNQELVALRSELSTLDLQLKTNTKRVEEWKDKTHIKIADLVNKHENFEKLETSRKTLETTKIIREIADYEAEITELFDSLKPAPYFTKRLKDIAEAITDLEASGTCKECGNRLCSDQVQVLMAEEYKVKTAEKTNEQSEIKITELKNKIDKLEKKRQEVLKSTNISTYEEQIKAAKKEANPYSSVVKELKLQLAEANKILMETQAEHSDLTLELDDTETLIDLTDVLRASLVKNTILELQTRTNNILTKHFNAEIKVVFEMQDNDKIDVTIFKDGNTCVYSQLSKGQRQLLKLSFGLSVMAVVGNKTPDGFNAVFIDEGTEGLDENLKTKVYGLLKELEQQYSSVFIVEHSESLKALIDNRIEVELVNGHSQIA